jgi:glycosyltransferase involved in cell wall biosynthesis
MKVVILWQIGAFNSWHGGNNVNSLAILIPTRNRPIAIDRILESISRSTLKPEQVIVVSSGQDIGSVIKNYSKELPITHSHTDAIGQIAQKRIGVGLIAQNITWCVFLDDDLLLEESALEIAMSTAHSYTRTDVIGIGLSTPVTSRGINIPVYLEILARLFKLSSNLPGKVLSSGHASSYLQSDSIIETQWLNGASIWKVECAKNYGSDLPSTPYAACEDLIFSYPLSKQGTLIYIPSAKVDFQDTELSNLDSLEVFRAASIWRLFFITKHKELSFSWFFLTQVLRSFYVLKKGKSKRLSLSLELFRLNAELIRNHLKGVSPNVLLNQLQR